MAKKKKLTQADVVKLLKTELPKHGFRVSETSMWDRYNSRTGRWRKENNVR